MTSDLPRITFSTFACNAAILSSERLIGTASRAIYEVTELRVQVKDQHASHGYTFQDRDQFLLEPLPSTLYPLPSQLLVVRSASALRRHPSDHLIRIHDVARLAVKAVGEIQERHFSSAV